MPAPSGKCKLCLAENVVLCDGHVIPRWAYARIRDEREGENPNPMKISGGKAVQVSKQVKEYMFCAPCDEQKFGPYDDYISSLACDGEAFPARDAVGRPQGSVDGIQIVTPGKLDAMRLVYFACSVVWRGHVAASIPRCTLGPVGETFRAYLNDERALPNTIQVTLSLLRDDESGKAELGQLFTMPHSMRKRPHHSHEFALCGMYFAVRTGASRSDVEGTLTSATPMIGIVDRGVYKGWLGTEILKARFGGKRWPLNSNGVRGPFE